jgi:acyl-CoA dehydrogenase
MILVPRDTPGVKVLRHLPVFGYDDAPHGHAEVLLENVRVPVANLLLGEGRGFEIAQGRLGPGRIHHCMRSIGVAERALELMCSASARASPSASRSPSSRSWHERIAESRCMIDQARLLVLNAAYMMDTVGNKVARKEIAMIKVVVPNMTLQVSTGRSRRTARRRDSDFRWRNCGRPAHAAYRRRPGRGPSQRHREAGAREVSRQVGRGRGDAGHPRRLTGQSFPRAASVVPIDARSRPAKVTL